MYFCPNLSLKNKFLCRQSLKYWLFIIILKITCVLNIAQSFLHGCRVVLGMYEAPHVKTNKMMCAQRRLIRLGGCPGWSESSLCAQWVAKDPSFLHLDSEDWSDWADAQADLSLRWTHIPLCWFCQEMAHMFYAAVICKPGIMGHSVAKVPYFVLGIVPAMLGNCGAFVSMLKLAG